MAPPPLPRKSPRTLPESRDPSANANEDSILESANANNYPTQEHDYANKTPTKPARKFTTVNSKLSGTESGTKSNLPTTASDEEEEEQEDVCFIGSSEMDRAQKMASPSNSVASNYKTRSTASTSNGKSETMSTRASAKTNIPTSKEILPKSKIQNGSIASETFYQTTPSQQSNGSLAKTIHQTRSSSSGKVNPELKAKSNPQTKAPELRTTRHSKPVSEPVSASKTMESGIITTRFSAKAGQPQQTESKTGELTTESRITRHSKTAINSEKSESSPALVQTRSTRRVSEISSSKLAAISIEISQANSPSAKEFKKSTQTSKTADSQDVKAEPIDSDEQPSSQGSQTSVRTRSFLKPDLIRTRSSAQASPLIQVVQMRKQNKPEGIAKAKSPSDKEDTAEPEVETLELVIETRSAKKVANSQASPSGKETISSQQPNGSTSSRGTRKVGGISLNPELSKVGALNEEGDVMFLGSNEMEQSQEDGQQLEPRLTRGSRTSKALKPISTPNSFVIKSHQTLTRASAKANGLTRKHLFPYKRLCIRKLAEEESASRGANDQADNGIQTRSTISKNALKTKPATRSSARKGIPETVSKTIKPSTRSDSSRSTSSTDSPSEASTSESTEMSKRALLKKIASINIKEMLQSRTNQKKNKGEVAKLAEPGRNLGDSAKKKNDKANKSLTSKQNELIARKNVKNQGTTGSESRRVSFKKKVRVISLVHDSDSVIHLDSDEETAPVKKLIDLGDDERTYTQLYDKDFSTDSKMVDVMRSYYGFYRKIFAVYSKLRMKESGKMLFRQRTLSYRADRRKAFFSQKTSAEIGREEENEKDAEDEPEYDVELELVELTPMEGYNMATVEAFVIQKDSQSGGKSATEDFKIYLDSTEFTFSRKRSSERIAIPRFITLNYLDRYEYSLGFIVKYFSTAKSLRRSKEPKLAEQHYWAAQKVLNPPRFGELCGSLYLRAEPAQKPKKSKNEATTEEAPLDRPVGERTILKNGEFTLPQPAALATRGNLAVSSYLPSPCMISYRLIDLRKPEVPSKKKESTEQQAMTELYTQMNQTINPTKIPCKKVLVQVSFVGVQTKTYLNSFACFLCDVECGAFKLLLTHMRHSHRRLSFKSDEFRRPYHIEIDVNRHFDSTAFAPQWVRLPFSLAAGSSRPAVPRWFILVSNEMRNYQAIFNDHCRTDYDLIRVATFAHPGVYNKKIFYHSKTCRPVLPHEVVEDSDDEMDLRRPWDKIREYDDVDDIIDVNDGERDFSKLWNIHTLLNRKVKNYFGICHLYELSLSFVRKFSREIFENNLKNNCKLHIFALHSIGYLKASQCEEICSALNEEERRLKVLGVIKA